ncbi:MAG: radical SAM protein [Chloroflexi bacterium]|nr:radical SAM protein [Chloroflexota bacterium]
MLERVRELFARPAPALPLPPGVYHYQAPANDPENYRMHLRIEADGSGFLLLNAATVLHLNQTAAEYAYLYVKQADVDEAAAHITQRYHGVRRDDAAEQYAQFKDQIHTLLTSQDLDPMMLIGCDRESLYAGEPSAPYRLDCALTYATPGSADPTVAPIQRANTELSTHQWITVLDKAWQNGIPHVIFTGGEPTLRNDLPELIAHAERNGQVTGLLTSGHRLSESGYLKALLTAGLDHTLITLTGEHLDAWGAISSFTYWKDLLKEDISVAAHITISNQNFGDVIQLFDRIAEAGISSISLTANSASLTQLLEQAREEAGRRGLDLIWDLPVPYSAMNPVALELAQDAEERQIPGAGKAWLYVEPDGDVLPSQGIDHPLGNMLTASWDEIWGEARRYQEQYLRPK